MKTLFWTGACLHHPAHGQAAIWRWWNHYRQHRDALGITHFAAFNDGGTNLPVEFFAPCFDGSKSIPDFSIDRLNVVYWPDHIGFSDVHNRRGFWRNLMTCLDLCWKQDFGRMVLVEADCLITSPSLMLEIGATEVGSVCYWCPTYNIPDTSIVIVGRDHYGLVKKKAEEIFNKTNCTADDRFEVAMDWTVVRTHRKGDRYPEFGRYAPGDAEYIAQLPINARVTFDRHIEVIS